MLNILSNRTYRHLFMAQVIALIGTGLATVALGLLAYDLAGDRAGAVLGTALAIKMSAYILVAPVAAAFADKFRTDNNRFEMFTIALNAQAFAGQPNGDCLFDLFRLHHDSGPQLVSAAQHRQRD